MAVYNPINLGDIIQQAGAIKGQQQRSLLADLQVKQAQDQEAKSSALDSLLQSNPAATSADIIKAGGASAIPVAAQQQQLTTQADEQTYRKMYAAAGDVAVAKDPIAAVRNTHPEFIKQFESQNGPGSFNQLNPDQVRQLAAGIRDHAQQLLVDPKTQFQVSHEDQRAANTQAGNNARQATTIAAENERARLSRGVTVRGQDLEAGRANKPQLVEVPNADGTVTKKWLIPGQLQGPTVGTSPQGAKLTETQGNAKAFGLRAQNANQTLEAMLSGPDAYDPTGMGGTKDLLTAGGVVTNRLASSKGQQYQNLAKAFIAPILRKESGAAISKDEWTQARQLYIPGPNDDAAVLAQKAQNRKDAIEGLRVQAGPTGLPTVRGTSPAGGGPPPDIAALLDKYK